MPQQLTHSSVRLEPLTTVPMKGRVRHFDELDEGAQEAVIHHVAGLTGGVRDSGDLKDGDVVVFTDYFSVRRA